MASVETSRKRKFDSLRYIGNKRASSLKETYFAWRAAQEPPLPIRCDRPECRFHHEPLIWNNQPFDPIVDHKDGVHGDNRPKNLQLLCPICDSQQKETRGGANRGKVRMSAGGFSRRRGELWDYTLPADAGNYKLTIHS